MFPEWSKRIESQYVPIEFFSEIMPPRAPRPYYGEGKFYKAAGYGNEWLINVAMLYEYGVRLFGKEFREIVPSLEWEAVRRASARDLIEEWAPKIGDEIFMSNPHYQSYMVLNVCRILYTVRNKRIASKGISAEWVSNNFPEWAELIGFSGKWEYGQEFDHREQTERFLRFAVDIVKGEGLSGD